MAASLKRLPAADCLKFCHRLVDGLRCREPPCRSEYSDVWSPEEWTEMLGALTTFFCLGVDNSSDEEVTARLGDLDRGHAEVLLTVLRTREEEIRQALVDRTNCISSTTLQDFDWQLKLALSSDKISSLQTPLLGLNLTVKDNRHLRPVTMEMKREELNTLVTSLEAANKVLLQLK